jgi:hypothetical protein
MNVKAATPRVIRPDVYAIERHDASQKLGEDVRGSGGGGLLYDSPRRRASSNVATGPLLESHLCAAIVDQIKRASAEPGDAPIGNNGIDLRSPSHGFHASNDPAAALE